MEVLGIGWGKEVILEEMWVELWAEVVFSPNPNKAITLRNKGRASGPG